MSKLLEPKLDMRSYLGIRPSSNPSSQKTPLLYEGVGSIPGVFKYTCDVCVSLDYKFYHISNCI